MSGVVHQRHKSTEERARGGGGGGGKKKEGRAIIQEVPVAVALVDTQMRIRMSLKSLQLEKRATDTSLLAETLLEKKLSFGEKTVVRTNSYAKCILSYCCWPSLCPWFILSTVDILDKDESVMDGRTACQRVPEQATSGHHKGIAV